MAPVLMLAIEAGYAVEIRFLYKVSFQMAEESPVTRTLQQNGVEFSGPGSLRLSKLKPASMLRIAGYGLRGVVRSLRTGRQYWLRGIGSALVELFGSKPGNPKWLAYCPEYAWWTVDESAEDVLKTRVLLLDHTLIKDAISKNLELRRLLQSADARYLIVGFHGVETNRLAQFRKSSRLDLARLGLSKLRRVYRLKSATQSSLSLATGNGLSEVVIGPLHLGHWWQNQLSIGDPLSTRGEGVGDRSCPRVALFLKSNLGFSDDYYIAAVSKVGELVQDLGLELVVKPHPRDDLEKLERAVGVKLQRINSLSEVTRDCHVVVSFPSTVLFELVAQGCPVVAWLPQASRPSGDRLEFLLRICSEAGVPVLETEPDLRSVLQKGVPNRRAWSDVGLDEKGGLGRVRSLLGSIRGDELKDEEEHCVG